MKKLLTFLFCIGQLFQLAAQDGLNDPTFNTLDAGFGNGTDQAISLVQTQPDGKIIIAGFFTKYKGLSRNGVARINTDESIDPDFDPGMGANNVINDLQLQSDGKILIGGSFTEFNGQSIPRLARLNPDGSMDGTFSIGAGFLERVTTIAVQTDGKIIVGGQFTSFNGQPAGRIVRLLPSGELDSSFAVGVGADAVVNEIRIQSDGKIVVAGNFASFSGQTASRLVRLQSDGSIDTTFTASCNAFPRDVLVQSDGKIVICGDMTTVNNVTVARAARLNANGSIDTTFTMAAGSGSSDILTSVLEQSDGKLVFAGVTSSTRCIKRVLADGSFDPTFASGTGYDSAYILDMCLLEDNSMLVVGGVTTFQGISRNHFVHLLENGDVDVNSGYGLGTGADGLVTKGIALQDGRLLIAGTFTHFNGVPRQRIACLTVDGLVDDAFASTTIGENSIKVMKQLQNGSILIAMNPEGSNSSTLRKYDVNGLEDATFSMDLTTANIVDIEEQADGKLLLAGLFTVEGNAKELVRLESNGMLDMSFAYTPDSSVPLISQSYAVLTLPGGKILLSGFFASKTLKCLNSDGSVDTTFQSPLYTTINSIRNMKLDADGKILLVGLSGTSKIMRLLTNGIPDPTFMTLAASSGLFNVTVDSDGRIYVLGSSASFTYGGNSVSGLARILSNGAYDSSFTVPELQNGIPYGFVLQASGKPVLFGSFNGLGNIGRNGIARLGSTNLNVSDFVPSTTKATVYRDGASVIIRNESVISEVSLYGLDGARLYKGRFSDRNVQIPFPMTTQVIILKIRYADGKGETRKAML